MSRPDLPQRGQGLGFPRVSGDEPLVGKADLPELMFSPRERG